MRVKRKRQLEPVAGLYDSPWDKPIIWNRQRRCVCRGWAMSPLLFVIWMHLWELFITHTVHQSWNIMKIHSRINRQTEFEVMARTTSIMSQYTFKKSAGLWWPLKDRNKSSSISNFSVIRFVCLCFWSTTWLEIRRYSMKVGRVRNTIPNIASREK